VSQRTLRRDVERLRQLGYPVQSSRGTGGGYGLAAGATVPPLLPDEDEAVALVLGLQTVATAAISGIGDAALQALAKITGLLPPRVRRRVEAVAAQTSMPSPSPRPVVDSRLLTKLAVACRELRRVRFAYRTRTGETARRLVDPHRLVGVGGRWYLLAWDLDRHDWRTFRLDRMAELATTASTFRARTLPDPDAAAYVQASIATAPSAYDVDVLIHAPAEVVSQEVGTWRSVEAYGPNRTRLRMGVDDLSWPAMILGALDADFEVLEPPALARHLRRIGRRFTQATRRAAPPKTTQRPRSSGPMPAGSQRPGYRR
jgi:predicted DNA-binding transcriptional regulator YafY